ncbi:hypothetical protein B0H19DRAFT_1086615 [Mycena capillaripes]|nr:hypothetical protein B0H19DRAFT_1086615 [Mycena capillaripes]
MFDWNNYHDLRAEARRSILICVLAYGDCGAHANLITLKVKLSAQRVKKRNELRVPFRRFKVCGSKMKTHNASGWEEKRIASSGRKRRKMRGSGGYAERFINKETAQPHYNNCASCSETLIPKGMFSGGLTVHETRLYDSMIPIWIVIDSSQLRAVEEINSVVHHGLNTIG